MGIENDNNKLNPSPDLELGDPVVKSLESFRRAKRADLSEDDARQPQAEADPQEEAEIITFPPK